MFTTGKNGRLRLFFRFTAMLLVLLLLVSCGGGAPSGGGKQDNEGKSGTETKLDDQQSAEPDDQKDVNTDVPGPGTTDIPAEAYTNFIQVKGELFSILTDALASNDDTALESMSLLGVAFVDMALLPVSSFGYGESAANAAMGFLGASDIVYAENGNQYSVKYKSEEGEQYELQGEYDSAADALKCSSFIDGEEFLFFEYRQSPFGYVSQSYGKNDDGSRFLYQMAISGKNGIIGISDATGDPPALTGSEAIDFPKACTQWYAIDGDQFTGLTSGGEEITFTYIPSEDE